MNAETIRKSLPPIAIGLLLAAYFYLNGSKIDVFRGQLTAIMEGAPAAELTLTAGPSRLLGIAVPSSDIFDGSGESQVVILPVAKAVFAALKERAAEVAIEYGGRRLPGGLSVGNFYLGVRLPGKKVYLVPDDAVGALAAIAAYERGSAAPVLYCVGDEFCRTARIIGTSGMGPVQGPYLDTEEQPDRRGLPRGHWGYGPVTTLKIAAARETRATLTVSLLQLPGDQRITFSQHARAVRVKKGPHAAAGLLVPRTYLIDLALQPGENEVEMRYSRSWDPPEWTGQPLGAYITKMQLAAPE